MRKFLFVSVVSLVLIVGAAENYRPVKVTSDAATLDGQGVELLYDGKMNPACAFLWPTNNKVSFILDLGEVKDVEGFRFLSGRSWVNCGIQLADFSCSEELNGKWTELKKDAWFRPANTYKTSFVTWPAKRLRYLKVDVKDTYDFKPNYYSFYTKVATRLLPKIFETPIYDEFSGGKKTVQIAEVACFKGTPDDLPLPNKPEVPFPQARLERDWLFQDAATSNISHVANTTADTTKPDRLGRDISALIDGQGLPNDEWRKEHQVKRTKFLKEFRGKFTQFIYVKHIVMGNSIIHATDDLTDSSYNEWQRVPDYTKGGSQLILATLNEDGSVSQEVLLSEPNGIIRDPNLSFDAKTLVFAKRTNLTTDNYHLWTLNLETRELKQITFDFMFPCSDIEPTFVQDGSIVFQSTRCCHSVDCWPLPVSNMFRCNADGTGIRRIGFDQVQTFYPQVMQDGRVSFTRWEYNDRNAAAVQQLMVMNPDGTKQSGLFANNSEFPFSLLHARSVPDSEKLLMISCGHHVGQKGRLAEANLNEGDDYSNSTYDPKKTVWPMNTNAVTMTFPGNRRMSFPLTEFDGPSNAATTNMPGMWYIAGAAMNVAPGRARTRMPRDYQYNAYDMHTQFGPQWAYPFPLDDEKFLVSYMPEGCRYYRGPYSSRFGIYAMKVDGSRELLAFDWNQHCMQPVPVIKREVHALTQKKIDYRDGFGTFYVQNVYEGEAMKGAPKGCVKKIRVIGLEYRPVHIGWNWQYGWHSTQGKIGTPISVGNGAYDVKHILGEVDVEDDGSAMFTVPARTPIYFQLIDEKGCCIQTMRSWSTLQPGEVNGCVGCHERPSASAPEKYTAKALKRPPQKLKPWREGDEHPFMAALEKDGPLASLDNFMGLNRPKSIDDASDKNDGFSFNRIIQPILTAKCVSCHDGSGAKAPKAMDLRDVPGEIPPSDDRSHRAYSAAYLSLSYKGFCNEKVNFAHGLGFTPFRGPYAFGAARSEVWKMLEKGHKGVKLTDRELRSLACWIDLCVPFCGSYIERNKWAEKYRQRFLYVSNKRSVYAWHELNDIRKEYGMEPVPLTGFVEGVKPTFQRYWDE